MIAEETVYVCKICGARHQFSLEAIKCEMLGSNPKLAVNDSVKFIKDAKGTFKGSRGEIMQVQIEPRTHNVIYIIIVKHLYMISLPESEFGKTFVRFQNEFQKGKTPDPT